jgi:hypothetical protein
MNLQNGYKVIYEKAADGKRTFYASKTGIFANAEQIGEAVEIGKYKLIYEKNGQLYGSTTGTPSDEDKEFTAFKKVVENGYVEPTVTKHPAYADAITTNGDSHGKLFVENDVVTLKATGTIKPATNPNGNTYHHVGFKITAPEGIDPANVIITRPDGKTRVMANILDGANFTNMYWQPTEDERVFTYYIDWNNDGVNDLTVVIDATKATLLPQEETPEA